MHLEYDIEASAVEMHQGLVSYYNKGKLEKKMSFKDGSIKSNETIELIKNIKMYERNDGKEIYASAEKATVKFNDLSNQAQMSEVENMIIQDNIQIKTQEHTFRTEFAIFDYEQKTLQSRTEVEVYGENGKMVSETGFELSMDQSELKLFGPVVGFLNEN